MATSVALRVKRKLSKGNERLSYIEFISDFQFIVAKSGSRKFVEKKFVRGFCVAATQPSIDLARRYII